MELSEIISTNGDGAAVVMWRGKIAVHLLPMSGEMERRSQKVMKPQWRGHQKMDDKLDLVSLRDFYCEEVILDIDGLTKDGQPYGKRPDERKELWDKTPDFRTFVIQASADAANFEAEKNG